jgi:hypothetical protein
MRQTVIHNYYIAKILYYFWCILTILNAKTQNYKVVDSIKGYDFHVESIFI